MTPEELKARTRQFAGDVIRFARSLPPEDCTRVMKKQLVRAATSVGANYRAVCLAKSAADMIAKLKIVEEEADETMYWLELLTDTESAPAPRAEPLHREASELFRIMSASVRTLRSKGK
jgi:four helix bundle protein